MTLALDVCIDVSDNNGAVDWPAVFAAGIRLAFVKIMQSPTSPYPWGRINLLAARQAGLIAVPYLFVQNCAASAAIVEFVDRAELARGEAFALDWEGRASQAGPAALVEEIGEGIAAIAGRPPIGYWGIPGSTPTSPTARMLGWDRWVPRYPAEGVRDWAGVPPRWQLSPELYWRVSALVAGLPLVAQYTAWGRIAGISGNVDRSVIFAPDGAGDDWLASRFTPPAAGAPEAR